MMGLVYCAPGAGMSFSPRLTAAPANARILVSRNKRDGRYCGSRRSCPSQHFREGHDDDRPLPLRARRWA